MPTIEPTCLDVVQLYDIDLGKGRSLPNVSAMFPRIKESEAFRRFKDSFEWLFDPQEESAPNNDGEFDPPLENPSQNVNCPYSLPRFDRFSLARDKESTLDQGGAITVSQALRVAVLSTSTRYMPPFDALTVKRNLGTDFPNNYKDQISKLFPYIAETELMFSLISHRYEAAPAWPGLAEDGTWLGEVFSGGLDHENQGTLGTDLEVGGACVAAVLIIGASCIAGLIGRIDQAISSARFFLTGEAEAVVLAPGSAVRVDISA